MEKLESLDNSLEFFGNSINILDILDILIINNHK